MATFNNIQRIPQCKLLYRGDNNTISFVQLTFKALGSILVCVTGASKSIVYTWPVSYSGNKPAWPNCLKKTCKSNAEHA